MRDGVGRSVDDGFPAVSDHQVLAVGHFTNFGARDFPVVADFAETVDVLRGDDGAHALLRFRGQDFRRGHVFSSQRNGVEVDLHTAVTGCCQLRRRTGQARATEVLNTDNDTSLVQIQAAFGELLLSERVAYLHSGEFALGAGFEGIGGQHRHTADAIEARAGTEEHDLVAQAGGKRQLQVLHLQRTHTQGVDQWVGGVRLIEDSLATNVRQAQAIAVPADTGHDTGQHSLRVGGVGRSETKLIHHRNWACTHRHNVADDTANTRRSALVGFNVAGVIVGFHAEGHGIAVANIDHAGVLTDTGKNLRCHLVGGGFTKVAQVHL